MTSKNVPGIRFLEFNEEWKQFKLGEVVEIKDSARISNTLWVSKGVPYLRSSDLVDSGVTGELFISDETYQSYKGKTGAPEKDDVLFTSGGKVGIIYHKIDDDPVYVQGGSILYAKTSKSSKLSGTYLSAFFSAPMMVRYIDKASTGLTLKHFTLKPANDAPIFISSLKEQNQIGEFFNKINEYISLHQRELAMLKQTKQGFLQKMFPKEGESVPELRFPGFTGEWKKHTLGETVENLAYGLNASSKEYDGENKYIRITDIDDSTHKFLKENITSPNTDLSLAEDYLLKEGDILFARTGASVGKTYICSSKDGRVYYAGFLIRARVKDEYIPEFIFQNTLTSKYLKFIKVASQRSGQPGVNAQEYASFSFSIPNQKEQQAISEFFKQLDEIIVLHQQELDALKQTKQAFLQKMFV
jgi:type I restriction enzyme S subunit